MWAPILSYTLKLFAEALGEAAKGNRACLAYSFKDLACFMDFLPIVVATLAQGRGISHRAGKLAELPGK